MSDNYAEETKPLFKLLKTEAFRFVIVRYNHYSLVSQLEQDLKRLFPNRPLAKADAQKLTYQDISKQYFDLKQGFFFLENFDILLKEERNSLNKETPPMKIENERRRHITAGLNLRRDKLAQFPIALFVFIPITSDPFFAKTIMEKMPDLWSFRSFMMDLEKEIVVNKNNFKSRTTRISGNLRTGDIIEFDFDNKKDELKRLLNLLEKTPKNEIAYQLTLYPQIVDKAMEVGEYNIALLNLNEWEKKGDESSKGSIWLKKGDILLAIGDTTEALFNFERAHHFFVQNERKSSIAVSLERLGNINVIFGNLEKALIQYHQYNKLEEELYAANPNNPIFKNSLSISAERLGTTYSALDDIDKALFFYEKSYQLSKELYDEYPHDLAFKNSLAVSYAQLGNVHITIKDLEKALELYNSSNKLFKELYSYYSNNILYKINLSISYSKIGMTYLNLGKLDRASKNFKSFKILIAEVVSEHMMNVEYQSAYAEAIAVSNSINRLISNNVSNKELLKAKVIFDKLCQQTKSSDFKKKAAIIDKMLEPDSDLKALILEMSMF